VQGQEKDMPSCASLFYFLEKKKTKGTRKGRGEEDGKEDMAMPFLLQGTLWGEHFRKEEWGARDREEVVPSCSFLLDFLEKKKTRGTSKEGVNNMGRNAWLDGA